MMKKILILGQSIAAASAAREIKRLRPQWHVIFCPGSGGWPARRDLWPRFLMKDSEIANGYWQSPDVLKNQGVEVILDKDVTRINLKRKRAHFSDRSQLEFEMILLTELPQYGLPEVKGNNKKGFYHLRLESDFRRLRSEMEFLDTITFQPSTWWGIEAALSMSSWGKDIYLVIPRPVAFWGIRTADFAMCWKNIFANHRVTVIEDQSIKDVLGDSDIRAVRFEHGKVVASDAVIFESVPFDFRVFSDDDIVADRVIRTKGEFRTAYDYVFVADTMNIRGLTNDSYVNDTLENEGLRVGRIMADEDPGFADKVVFQVQGLLGESALSLIGPQPQPDWKAIDVKGQDGNWGQLFCQQNRITSALLVNSQQILSEVQVAVSNAEVFDADRWGDLLSLAEDGVSLATATVTGQVSEFGIDKDIKEELHYE